MLTMYHYCTECHYETDRIANFDRHKILHLNNATNPYKCRNCDCAFDKAYNLTLHIRRYCKNDPTVNYDALNRFPPINPIINPINTNSCLNTSNIFNSPTKILVNPLDPAKMADISVSSQPSTSLQPSSSSTSNQPSTSLQPSSSSPPPKYPLSRVIITDRLGVNYLDKNGKYKCPTCYKSYTEFYLLKNHTGKCKLIKCNTECEYCHIDFQTPMKLSRHRKNCKGEIKPVVLNEFGKEDYSHIKNEEIIHYIKRSLTGGFIDFIKKIFENPLNRNIKLYRQKKLVLIYKNNNWEFDNINIAINTLIENSAIFLNKKYNDPELKISEGFEEDNKSYIIQNIINLFTNNKSFKAYKKKFTEQIYIILLNQSIREHNITVL